MRTYLLSTAAALALIGGIATAQEAAAAPVVTFKIDKVTTTQHTAGHGLLIESQSMAPQTFNLAKGQHATVNLLRIWTNEGSVKLFEDTVEKLFSMNIRFSEPKPGFSTTVGGDTSGTIVFGGKFGLQTAGLGYLDFNPNYYTVNFTSNAGKGKLGIRLEDVVFNRGDFAWLGSDLNPGRKSGGVVAADFKLIDFTPVPEPASLALLGAGLLGLGLARRRGAAAA